MPFATVRGIRLIYDIRGHGTPVLWIHGFPLGRWLWDPQVEALGAVARSIAVDLRGFGGSSVPEGSYTMDSYAADLRGLLDILGIDQAVLAGLSMGGYVAFAFYAAYPERVRGLILADTRHQADTPEVRANRYAVIERIRAEGTRAAVEAFLPRLFGGTTQRERPERVETLRRKMMTNPAAGLIGALQAMAERPDRTDLLPSIRVPTLVIVGEEDAVTPPDVARQMAEGIPQARVVVIPRAGHLANVEAPEAFNEAVWAFLQELAK
ncbi:MAG: alpha/beta fold hydrolase [Anaerolineae bacterium]|nr:alpha/beta hydrolase [Thermoflexus sp.]MDW8065795.1 alpha/beta fold hydrolase [Anaerolineae bacterium]